MTACNTGAQPRPIIGIMPKYLTADRIPKTVSSCDSLLIADNYLRAVAAAGGLPVIMPVTEDPAVYEAYLDMVDGFLLTGGADLDPRLYEGDVDNENLGVHVGIRERLEYRVLDYAFANDVPLLGICRGIQLLNVYKGGTLYEDLAEHLPEVDERGDVVKHWQDIAYSEPSHRVRLVEGSLIHELLGVDEVTTNSMHHQGLRRLADGLEAMAFGPGDLVEAVREPRLSFAVGLQWHPEYLGDYAHMNRIFERFVAEACAYRARAKRKPIR